MGEAYPSFPCLESAAPGNTETTESTESSHILVAYFSATHTTEGVAEKLADGLGADLYQIVPEEPYTDADLNYNDDNCRANTEMNDPNARPAISGSVENVEQYDTIFWVTPSGGATRRGSSARFWKAMISPVKR